MFNLFKKSLFVGTVGLATGCIATRPANENLFIEMAQNLTMDQKILLYTTLPFVTTFHDYVLFKTATIYVTEKPIHTVGIFNHWYGVKE